MKNKKSTYSKRSTRVLSSKYDLNSLVNSKRSQEGVISTVLLIMLTIAAASMLFVFVIPWIRDMMDEGKICSDAQGQISIETGKYTCYNSTATKIMITRGEKRDLEIEGIVVSLIYSGTSKKFDIKEDGKIANVTMYDGSETLRLPDAGGSETYVFKNITGTERATAALVFKGDKLCEAVTEVIVNCNAVS